jgi:hypothetical protein
LHLRKRKEIQEVLRRLTLFAVAITAAAAPVSAAIWPEQFGTFKRTSFQTVSVSDRQVWDEYGLEEAEQAEYASAEGHFTATAYRLKDPTSALAVFQWQKPAKAAPSELTKLAVETSDSAFVMLGNYVLSFQGWKPTVEQLELFSVMLPRLDQSPLPTLPDYLPSQNRIPGSERYVIGPASLEKFEPRIPPSVAAFHLGAEAQLAKYTSPHGELDLAIFSYPTPHIARDLLPEFQKLPGAMVKRSGPLLVAVLQAPNQDDAEKLLAKINYQANITLSQDTKKQELGVAELLIGIFTLTGVLLAFALVAGLAFGGIRFLSRRWLGRSGDEDPMILLHLGDR